MNSNHYKIYILLLLLIGCTTTLMRAQTELNSSVFGNGGDLISSGNNHIHGTVGQTLIGQTSENDQMKKVGFWYDVQYLVSSVEQIDEVPIGEGFILNQNFPNPAHHSTTITFAVPANTDVQLILMNSKGQIITNLVDESMLKGTYQVSLNVSDLPPGIYLYQLFGDQQLRGIRKLVVQ